MSKKFLVVVDMQNDFIDGALGSPDALSIVSDVVRALDRYKDYERVFTMDTHSEDYGIDPESTVVPVPHCIVNSKGWLLRAAVAHYINADSVLVRKSTFGVKNWSREFESRGYSPEDMVKPEFVICGLCTDICVVSNAVALRSAFPDAKITVIENACAGTSKYAHESALVVMKSIGCNVVNERED
jgi:nicotinamidase-related amidase